MSWEIGNPIPDDWGEADGWNVGLFLFPRSDKWGLIVRTVLRVLSRGRFWRRSSGTITEAQDAGRLAYMSFTYVSFQELLDAINGLKTAVEGQTTQVQIDNVCCDQVTPPSPPTPPPETPPTSDITDPTLLPPAYEGGVQEYLDTLCQYANALHYQIERYLVFLGKLDTVAAIITVIVALLGLIFPEPATTAIGGVTLVTIVSILVTVDGGLNAVATWAEDALPFWQSQQETFVCFAYDVMFAGENWRSQIQAFVADALNTVSETFPNPVVETAVSWIEPFLLWFEKDLYDKLETLEPSPTPIPCASCGVLPCDEYYPGVTLCAAADYFEAPDASLVDVQPNAEVTVSWTYEAGIVTIDYSCSGSTPASTPGVNLIFDTDPNRTRIASIVTVLSATVNDTNGNPVDISGKNLEQTKPFALVNTEGSSWRDCVEQAVEAEGVTVPGGAGSGHRTQVTIDGIRPGSGQSTTVHVEIRLCMLENDKV